MKRSILQFESFTDISSTNVFRTIFKNQHGRVIFLSLQISSTYCTITDYFYVDRNQGKIGNQRYSAKPLKLQTIRSRLDDLLSVIELELDKKFYGVQFIHSDLADLPLDQYVQSKLGNKPKKYQFLIMVGDGKTCNGLPTRLRTRIKNKIHRSIYVELAYYKEGKGVVRQCSYYDRKYRRQNVIITPPTLISCFFPYSREGILNLFNHELCCEFNHMIITDGIDIDSNTTPLCGAV